MRLREVADQLFSDFAYLCCSHTLFADDIPDPHGTVHCALVLSKKVRSLSALHFVFESESWSKCIVDDSSVQRCYASQSLGLLPSQAHAEIVSIDDSEAKALPGFIAIYFAKDVTGTTHASVGYRHLVRFPRLAL